MAIGKISGVMLQSDLSRDGTNLSFDSNLIYLDVTNRFVGINNTVPAYALDVTGTAHANIILGETLTSTGNVNGVNGYFTANVVVLGNINAGNGNVSSNSGVFYGNAITGIGALYAGLPSGFTALPNVVAQFSSNANSYAQINLQNISSGNAATTDLVATADNGTDTIYYVDLGIASNTYNNSNPNNSLGTSLYPNDAYLYSQGNTSATPGGNLVIGTNTVGKVVRIISGGHDAANVVATFYSPTTISSNASTGAFVVNGSTGIGGNLNVSGIITTNSLVVSGGTITNVNIGNITFNNTTIGTATANANIILQPNGTGLVVINSTRALQVPSGNTAQEPNNAAPGALRFNTDSNSLEFYTGTGWAATTPSISTQTITPDGSNVSYTLNKSTTTDGVIVNLNGVIQQTSNAYTITGNVITFSQVPQVTDLIEVRFLSVGVSAPSTGSLALISNVAPAHSTSTGTKGQVAYDSNYMYVCVDTNTWIRSNISTSF